MKLLITVFENQTSLNTNTLEWMSQKTSEEPRYYHSASVHKKYMYVFGGSTVKDVATSDLICFELKLMDGNCFFRFLVDNTISKDIKRQL